MKHKAVANSLARFEIIRFKHKDYVRMYNSEALVNVINRRISSNVH